MKAALVFAKLICISAGFGLVSPITAAQGFPKKPIRFIVPTSPGGSVDILARTVGQRLTGRWGQQIVVDNRPGAGGNIGAEIAAKATPDGYTVLVASSNFAINATLQSKLPYDPVRDFAAITLLGAMPNLLVVHPAVRAKSVRELIALAKSSPGQLNYASSGNGTSPHLTAELFKTMTGVDILHVPYKGASPAFTDLVGGQVQIMFASTVSLLPYVTTGRLRALAVTSRKRSPALRDMPTIAEAGVPEFEVTSWTAMMAPTGTPKVIIEALNSEIIRTLQTTDIRKRLSDQGYEVIGSTPEECSIHIKAEIAKWGKVVRTSGMRVE